MFLLIVNVLLLILGIFLKPVPALVLTAPLLLPVAKAMGVDPVHFGLIVVCNLAMGLFTPPVGGTLFVAAKIANARMGKITARPRPDVRHLLRGAGHRHLHAGLRHGAGLLVPLRQRR